MANVGVNTLAQLTTWAQDRADQLSPDASLTAQQWTDNINASIQALYGLLIQKYGSDYFTKLPPSTITADGVNDYFALPVDFLKLVGIHMQLWNAPNGFVTLRQFMMSEINRYTVPYAQPFSGVPIPQYRLLSSQQVSTGAPTPGDQIWFIPRPTSGIVFRVFYVPRVAPLVNSTDTWDGFNGWTEWVIYDAAIKALIKEETDISPYVQERALVEQRIEAEAANRNVADPQRVPDASTTGGGFGGGWWSNDGGYW